MIKYALEITRKLETDKLPINENDTFLGNF